MSEGEVAEKRGQRARDALWEGGNGSKGIDRPQI